MNILYQPLSALSEPVLEGLLPSFSWRGLGMKELVEELAAENVRVFVVDGDTSPVFLAVSVLQGPKRRELWVEGFWTPKVGWKFRSFATVLRMLAREWGCDVILTSIFEGRKALVLQKIGCKVDHVVMSLEIEDGR